MSGITAADVEIRTATDGDQPAVLGLLRTSLAWRPEDPNEEFFDWKHRQSPFGPSPAWVAVHEGRVVGFRTFLAWTFVDEDGRHIPAVRAVDTATAPDYRGLGIFRRLTLRAVAELTEAGVSHVFNTPNDKSRPGYLSMGWTVARRIPVGVRIAGPAAAVRMARARVPAVLWSEPTAVGLPAELALADTSVAEALLQHRPVRGVRTLRSTDYLRWRTGFAPLRYRLLLDSDSDPGAGGLVFRLRRRGPALEATVVELLAPDRRTGSRLLRRLLSETGADFAIGTLAGPGGLLVPLPGQGPQLTSRPLAAAPPEPGQWRLTLGDVELF